jgi:HD-GYP domain-containing protein (c-di-GMP phosphodiesterase class II)
MASRINKELLKSMLTMGAVVEARDAYTGGHLWRVSQFAKRLALKLGMSNQQAIQVALGGFLHDLGKVGVPDAILNNKAVLTSREYAVIKTHAEIGADLIVQHPLSFLAYDVIRHHHERVDGKGYPDQLIGEEISIEARMVSIADAFDAMTSTRPYRKGMPIAAALTELKKCSGSQFDLELVSLFVAMGEAGDLEGIVLHSDEGQPLLECPVCGPVLAVTHQHKEGDGISCRVCGGSMRLHQHQHAFELEVLSPISDAQHLKPQADLGPIDDLVKQTPDFLE